VVCLYCSSCAVQGIATRFDLLGRQPMDVRCGVSAADTGAGDAGGMRGARRGDARAAPMQ
jgi:hypothetical protein